jgi:class 3 adenylate cyclase
VRTLPEGTITLLFTDIEGSTALLHRLGAVYATVVADHRAILRDAFAKWNGHEVDTQGDSFFVVFTRADALAAAAEAQRGLATQQWAREEVVEGAASSWVIPG